MIIVVLPAFNEEAALGPLLTSMQATFVEAHLDYRVVVVDDGSKDATAEVANTYAKTMPVTLVKHEVNKGLSEALKTGFLTALDLSGPRDTIVTMDADNTHAPGLILRMSRLISEGHDVVIASRYVEGARIRGLAKHRQLLSLGLSYMCRAAVGLEGVKDYSCGFRAYRAAFMKQVLAEHREEFFKQPGFSCMLDLLIRLAPYEPIITEVPMILRYDLKPSLSKMNVTRTVGETLELLWKTRGARWKSH